MFFYAILNRVLLYYVYILFKRFVLSFKATGLASASTGAAGYTINNGRFS
jgi:hypothetical protein